MLVTATAVTSVMSNSVRPHRRQLTRLPCPWDSPGKNTGVGCHCLLRHANKVILKILQARLQHYVNQELSEIKAGFRKGRGTRDQIANIHWIIEKTRDFQKNIYLCFTDYVKAFVWIITNCRKFLKR